MISLPKKPKVVDRDENWAKFEVDSLYPGYGITIGNSLRRVLLSSLEGAACTQVKIEGAQHEFSTISGVLEDVVSIVMNLKQINFKMFSDEPQTVTLSVKGEKEVKASDLEMPSQVEVVNEGSHIATITDGSKELEMELRIEKGVGYIPKERIKEGKLETGNIALDAVFTPIERVSFDVEDMRVGERTDFNRLTLEVETDGSITPEKAFVEASNILTSHFSLLGEGLQERKEKKEEALSTDVEDLDLSTRTVNALQENNIKTVSGIVRRKEETLLDLPGLGQKGVDEIKEVLSKHGLELK